MREPTHPRAEAAAMPWTGVAAVIPALDEADSIARVVGGLRRRGIAEIVVADNGSRDATAERARAAGAHVVHEARRGYGSACQAALAALSPRCRTVVFCDADGADDLTRLGRLVAPVVAGEIDLCIGARILGSQRSTALSPPQRCGNLVATSLIRLLYGARVRDLGPFRCIDRGALERLAMADPAFGWTAEMQVKAYRQGLRVREIAVAPRPRLAGTSKISGTLRGVIGAGWGICTTILRHARSPIRASSRSRPASEPARRRHRAFVPAILALATAAPASEAIAPDDLPAGWDDWRFIPYAEGRHAQAADLDEGGGDLAVSRGRIGLRVEKIPAIFLHLGINAEFAGHRFDADQGSGFDADTLGARLGFTPTVRFHQHWSAFAPLDLRTGIESGADLADGVSGSAGLGLQYHHDLERRIGVGLVVQGRIEDDPTYIPFITADWRFDDHWRLIVIDPVDRTSRLRYRIDSDWSVGLRGTTDLVDFRLEDDRVLEDSHVALAVEGAWHQGNDRPVVSAFLGAVLWREVTLRDDNGDEIAQRDVDPALQAGIDARWRF